MEELLLQRASSCRRRDGVQSAGTEAEAALASPASEGSLTHALAPLPDQVDADGSLARAPSGSGCLAQGAGSERHLFAVDLGAAGGVPSICATCG